MESKEAAFSEVFHNTPKNVKKSGKKGKAKRAMMIAIALSKAGMSKKKGKAKEVRPYGGI